MMKRQPTYERNCSKWPGSHIIKKVENGTIILKRKTFLEEDITDTGLKHLIKEFNKKQIPAESLISSCNEEILENAYVKRMDKITKKGQQYLSITKRVSLGRK